MSALSNLFEMIASATGANEAKRNPYFGKEQKDVPFDKAISVDDPYIRASVLGRMGGNNAAQLNERYFAAKDAGDLATAQRIAEEQQMMPLQVDKARQMGQNAADTSYEDYMRRRVPRLADETYLMQTGEDIRNAGEVGMMPQRNQFSLANRFGVGYDQVPSLAGAMQGRAQAQIGADAAQAPLEVQAQELANKEMAKRLARPNLLGGQGGYLDTDTMNFYETPYNMTQQVQVGVDALGQPITKPQQVRFSGGTTNLKPVASKITEDEVRARLKGKQQMQQDIKGGVPQKATPKTSAKTSSIAPKAAALPPAVQQQILQYMSEQEMAQEAYKNLARRAIQPGRTY